MENGKRKKAGLGRGLGNLLDTEMLSTVRRSDNQNETEKDNSVIEIDIEKIRTNPDNPRKNFDRTSIEELAQTIKQFGLLQPILVLKKDDHYQVISGERRLRACRQLNLEKVPCILKHLENQEMLEVSLIENIQREQLNPVEEGVVYRDLIEKYNITQEALSGRVGKNRATIANRIRLLQLPMSLQAALADHRATEGQVRPLLGLTNEVLINKLANEILTHQLSARQVEDLVKKYKGNGASAKTKINKKEPSEITALKKELMDVFQTRVNIKHNLKNGRGSIIIDYFSLNDCDSLVKQLKSIKE
ncbi:MAG: ParB/RepB/Spo0J family partition protein [Spirochaetia bacterium]|nr:ParB/RepB/Spo0J family partition protein [Spirochaetia bacterium]